MSHSVLPPSGAAAWRRCAMWVTMNRLYPQPDTPATLEGNAAHWAAWEAVAGRPCAEGATAPNGIAITDEMIEGGELVLETLYSRMPPERFGEWNIERPVEISRIHPDCWGTPDAWAFDAATNTLEIVDYKFGFGFVDEYLNDQLIVYAAGIIPRLAELAKQPLGGFELALQVNMTIVQPRCYHRGPVRTWSVIGSDLRGHYNILAAAAAKAMGPEPTAKTNGECKHCPGRHACPALQKAAYGDSETAFTSSPLELPPAAASLELSLMERALERLTARVTGMREAVAQYGRQGHATPWHRLEQGYGRQTWTVPAEQVIAMGSVMGVDLSKPGVITPKQAKKAGIDEAVIKAYSITPLGEIKLVPNNPADARRVFGNN